MPIFDFYCEKCDKIVEKLVKNSGEEQYCVLCLSLMEKQIGTGSFILKGDGWYKPSEE